ncbi:MAG TPA: hypothetical protein ENN13_03385 [Candidatus Altiarchaeales archaeon]|nr:hypothetical protein [Candidatus Altiarchaeales archaeon]
MNEGFRGVLKFSGGVFVLAVFAIVLSKNLDAVRLVFSIDPVQLLLLLALTVVMFVINGLLIKYMMTVFDIQLPFSEYFGLGILTSIGNYVLPLRGGASLRAVYLKKKFKFPYKTFVSTLMGMYILVFCVYGGIGFLASIFQQFLNGGTVLMLPAFYLALFLAPLAFIVFHPKTGFARVDLVFDGWGEIKRSRVFPTLILVEVFDALARVFLMYAIFFSIGVEISFSYVVFVTVVNVFSLFINILPANIGVRELVITLASQAGGASVEAGLAVALVLRGTEVLGLMLCSPFALRIFRGSR